MSDFDSINTIASEEEYQELVTVAKEMAQANAHLHVFNEICWDKCVGKPGSKLDNSTETCLSNCVGRFIDTSLLITKRFAEKIQRSSNAM